MANGVGVETGVVFRESSVSTAKIRLAEATAAFQRTAAALMAAHSGESFQKVIPSLGVPLSASSTLVPGDSLRPALASKGGISFVIPKNKLSGALVPVVRNLGGNWESSNEPQKADEEVKRLPPRKTRWGFDRTQDPTAKRGRALALQTRAEQIAAQLESGHSDIDTNEANRSPSPPPIYDVNGQRTNTREGRRRELLELERREAIGECMQLNPSYKPPAGYKPVYKEAKLYIPVKDYPGYNFIGLILGPRGNTQKRMEAETGSKIAIRGKGAIKEGKKSNAVQGGRRNGKEADGAFEELHVHITADSIEKVDAAVALIEPLLTPVDEDRNTHKRKQLRELAEMNGTMRDLPKACCICGGTGHRDWNCPKDSAFLFQAKVGCQVCGDGGHPTIDCPCRHNGQGKVLDKEYLNFLEELGDSLAGANAGSLQSALSKSPAKDNHKDSAQGITTVGANQMPETPLDPNQLADVIPGPQPGLITASGPQALAWSASGMFPGDARVALPQQGSIINGERDRDFDGLSNDTSSQNVHPSLGVSAFSAHPPPAFIHPSHAPTFGASSVFHGQPPLSSANTRQEGPVHALGPSGQPGLPNSQLNGPGMLGQGRALRRPEFTYAGGHIAGSNKEQISGMIPFPVPPHRAIITPPDVLHSQGVSSNPASFTVAQVREATSPGPPPMMGRPPFVSSWPPPPSCSGATNSWSQNFIPAQAPGHGNFSKEWDAAPPHSNITPPPPPLHSAWKSGPAPQQLPSVWPLPSGPTWDRGDPSRTPPLGVLSASQPPWDVKQRPWEGIPPFAPMRSQSPASAPKLPPVRGMPGMGRPNSQLKPSHLLQPPSPQPSNQRQSWKVPQAQNVWQSPLQSSLPSPGLEPPPWKGPPSNPVAIPMLPPQPPIPSQSPHIVVSSRSSHSMPVFPPWHPQTQQPSKSGTSINFGSSTVMSSSSALHPADGPWGQNPAGVPSSRPDTSVPSHCNRGASQGQSYDPFSPTARSPRLTTSNVHQQQVAGQKFFASLPPRFGALADINTRNQPGLADPNAARSQPGLPSGQPPWQNPQVMGLNPRPAPPVPSTPTVVQEVDAEYENLMASVGVT